MVPIQPRREPGRISLLDELIDAFDADALHVGMDEVFLIGNEKCPRCKGKDVGELFAGVVNALHQHLVKDKGVEMLMWGDRLLDAGKFSYGSWEASKTGSHRAIDQIPKDIIICDWHYERRADYPSVRFFQQQGFRVLPSPWKNPDAGVAFIRCARKDATERMLGVLFTGWSAGGNGERLMAALKGRGRRQRQGHCQAGRRHHQGGLEGTDQPNEGTGEGQMIQSGQATAMACSPMTVTTTVRCRGRTSHSRWKICCQVPSTGLPSATGTESDGPMSVACKWE